MGKTLIRVDCVDQRLYISTAPMLASGGRNEDEIEFGFCSLWDGFEKTAVFYREKDDVYHAIITDDRCIIPHEVLTDEGWMYFGVLGVKGDITRTSAIMRYRIEAGAITEGTNPSDPTPDIYAQYIARIQAIERMFTSEPFSVTGNPVEIDNYGSAPIHVKTTVALNQSGEGDPSSGNPRPISVVDRFILTHTGADSENKHMSAPVGNMAAGSFDFSTGRMETTMVWQEFDGSADEEIGHAADSIRIPDGGYYLTIKFKTLASSVLNDRDKALCNLARYVRNTYDGFKYDTFSISAGGDTFNIKPDAAFISKNPFPFHLDVNSAERAAALNTIKDNFRTWLDANRPHVAYIPAEIITANKVPTPIYAFDGLNTLSVNHGTLTVEGEKSIPAAVGGLSERVTELEEMGGVNGSWVAGVSSIEGKDGDLTLDDIGAASKEDVDQLSEEIANIASESEYELIGETPVTLPEVSDIKLEASGEAEYTIKTPTVGDFEQLLAAGKVTLFNCAISKSKGYFEVVTTSDLTGFYQAYVDFVFDGLEIGKSYKIICNVDGLTNNQQAKLWHGSFAVWSGTNTSGASVIASHVPHKGPAEFTASETSVYVRYYPATNNPNLLAGWIGYFNSLYVNRAEMSDELTAIYSATGDFDGVLNVKTVPPLAVVSATPSANVYRKASTDITLTQAGKPADAKVTGERIATAESRLPLWGKTIANFGDSIFGNARPPLDVSTFLADNTGATVYNCAFGGCRMSQHVGHWDAFSMYRLAHAIADNDYALQDEALNYDDRVSYADEPLTLIKSIDFANLDILTVSYGTNDFTGNNAIDNADDPLDTSTVCGALRYSIETLLTAYPNLRIFVLLPTYRFWIDSANAYTDDAFNHTNDLGKTLIEYIVAIEKTAKAYNIPVIDNFAELGINKFNRKQYFPVTDGTHHNENGRKLIAKHLAHKLW